MTKVYSGTVAVKQADFAVRRGAVNVLVGENGAGKSTLVKMIAGVERPTAGRILLDGEPIAFADTRDAMAHGIGMVFQELNLFGNLTVAENIFANREIMRHGRIDHAEQERQTEALMERLQTGVDPRAMVDDLMIGQQQLVEIAKAVARNARILIMDEPTSALSAPEVDILFRVIADLKAKGVAIVYISHRLEEMMRIGDYITVLRDGRVTGARRMAEVDLHWIVRQMIGSDAKDFSTPGEHGFGGEALRAEERLADPHHRRLRGRSCLAVGARRRDRRPLRPDGRRAQRVPRMRHGAPSDARRAASSSKASRCASATSAAASPAAWRSSPRIASATAWCRSSRSPRI